MSSNEAHAAKKAYEIAYAIFRVVPKVFDQTLAGKMTTEATEILASSVAGNYPQAVKSLEVLSYLVKFGTELNFISFMNGEVLIREIGNLQASIAESLNSANANVDIDISEYFSSKGLVLQEESPPVANPVTEYEKPKKESAPSSNIIKSGMRQIAILDRIRQSGNCRLRDIQEILPDTSERTIRYDLEDLMERNIIERIGNGGPSVHYRIRQMSNL